MTPAETAILMLVALAIVGVLRANRLFDATCIGAFFWSHAVFVVVGVLALPWLIDQPMIRLSYPFLHWESITDADLRRVIIVAPGGVLLVLLGYTFAESVHRSLGAVPLRWGALFRDSWSISPLVSNLRVWAVTLPCILVAGSSLATQMGALQSGILAGYIGGDIAAQFASREAVQSLGRAFYLIVFNALPFLAVLGWLQYRLLPSATSRTTAFLLFGMSLVFLISTFEKRPLVLLLLTMAFVQAVSEYHRRLGPKTQPAVRGTNHAGRVPWVQLGLGLGFPLVVLAAMYLLSTNIVKDYGLSLSAAGSLMGMVLLRIFGRLAVMPLFYVHYFPNLHAHYGVSNIGLIAKALQTPLYQDTREVWAYFTDIDVGSGAIGAVTNFYAAYGWSGWLIGCLTLGLTLYACDRWLASLSPTSLNRTLWIMMLVFVSTLSQASVPRALSTYGGMVFLLLWAVLGIKVIVQSTRDEGPSSP